MTPLIQAEQAVLGAVFLDPGQLDHLSPGCDLTTSPAPRTGPCTPRCSNSEQTATPPPR